MHLQREKGKKRVKFCLQKQALRYQENKHLKSYFVSHVFCLVFGSTGMNPWTGAKPEFYSGLFTRPGPEFGSGLWSHTLFSGSGP